MLHKFLPVHRGPISGPILYVWAKIMDRNENMVADVNCQNKNHGIFELQKSLQVFYNL